MKNLLPTRMIISDKMLSRRSRGVIFSRCIGLIVGIACFASLAVGQNRYQITRIPVASGANSAALGINNNGDVVGYSFQGDDYQAFLYSASDQSMTDIGSLGGKLNAACAINDAGQVTGYSQDGNGNLLAFIYSRSSPIASLGTLENGSTSEAFGINKDGAVVGDSQSGNQSHRPVLFRNGSVQDLGLAGSNEEDALETAYAINDSGQIVGRHSVGSNTFHAFLHSGGNSTDFGTLGGTNGEALAINKNGQIVGDSDTSNGTPHAFLFAGSMKDLGTLPGYDNASYARGINNSGDIVGESDSADQKRAFLYSKGHLVELDKVASNLSEAGFNSLDVAYGINDRGLIVGYGTTSDNVTAAFVAVPEGAAPKTQAAVPQQQQQQFQPQHPNQPVSESGDDNYDVFYSRLSSEGTWVEAGNYGYCFRPHEADPDWRPYRDGHWVWTDRGWYWDSSERFGWATYHYGRWVSISGTGWCWVPGHQWAPAWVSWRESGEHVGWAPLPPEAAVSVQVGISSWSDAHFGIGPSAYTFIRYQDWSAPNYAQHVIPPAQNVQIITQTKNVTNIVTNNTVINNYGPQVQTVAAKTNQNIQPVKLVVNQAKGPNANYSHSLSGNQLNVVAPPATLKAVATQTPAVQTRITNPTVEKGWQGVKPEEAEKLKKTIAEQNPVPKDLPKATAIATPEFLKKGQGAGAPGATPTPVPGQKQPPNLVKPTGPGAKSPSANVGAAPGQSPGGRKSVPPNLLGVKPSGTPGGTGGGKPAPTNSPGPKPSPTGEKATLPGGSPAAPKQTPPNLNAPKPSTTPEARPTAIETPKSNAVVPGGTPHVSATPRAIETPSPEKKPETTPTPHHEPNVTPTPHHEAPNAEAPKATTTPHHAPANVESPKPTAHHEPSNLVTPKPTAAEKVPPAGAQQEMKPPVSRPTTEKPEVHPTSTARQNEGGKEEHHPGGKEEGKHPRGSASPEKKE
jgi:probable HAF family extracellular repeat protein